MIHQPGGERSVFGAERLDVALHGLPAGPGAGGWRLAREGKMGAFVAEAGR